MSLPIALQLYTLRQQAAADFVGTLKTTAEAGYTAIEFAGYGGLAAPELRRIIDDLGLRAVSSHVSYQAFTSEPDAAIEDLLVLGCNHAVIPGLPSDLRNAEAAPALAETFNRVGETCRAAGLRLGYHNHAWELEPMSGGTMLDLLVDQTEPSLVGFELDVFWALVAGVDPIGWIEQHPNRVPLLHAKELAAGPEHRDTTVGDGITDWSALIATATVAGTEWLIVEQEDDSANASRDIRRSLGNLTELTAASSGT